jgi:tetratricopeptide (TPR) repeat protein
LFYKIENAKAIGDKLKAKEYYEEAIKTAKTILHEYPKEEYTIHCYALIGDIYKFLGNYQLAIEWFNKGLQKYEEIKDKEKIALTKLNQAVCYTLSEQHKEALEILEEVLNKYKETVWVKSTEGVIYASLGEMYGRVGELENIPEYFDKAIEYLKLGLEKATGIFDKGEVCWCIAVIYHHFKNDIETAKIWYQKIVDEYPNSEWIDEAKKVLEEIKK